MCEKMPQPYPIDLRWRIVWISLSSSYSVAEIAKLYLVFQRERTVWRYISLFQQTGDVLFKKRRDGPRSLMGDFEEIVLLRIILENPGIYLHEVKERLFQKFGVPVSVPTICRTLHKMGCTCQCMCRVAM